MPFNDSGDFYARLKRLALDGDVEAALVLEREAERRDDKGALCLALVVGMGADALGVQDEVVLVSFGESKVKVVREVVRRVGLGVWEAKNLIDRVPVVVLTRANAEQVAALQVAIEAVGGVVALQSSAHRELAERVGGLVAGLAGSEQEQVLEQVLQVRLRRARVTDVSALVGAMHGEVRAVAAQVFKRLYDAGSLPGDEDLSVEDVRLLLQLDNPRGLASVKRALGVSSAGGDRAMWVSLLGGVGPGSLEGALALLGEALSDADTSVQRGAVRVLGQLGEAAAGVLGIAASVVDTLARRAAFEALVKLDGVEDGVLVQGLFDADYNIRGVVVGVLEARGWEPTDDAQRVAYLLAGERWEELEACGQVAVAALIGTLDELNWFIQRQAIKILCKFSGDDVEAALIRVVNNADNNTDNYVRLTAVRGLEGRNSEAATRALVGALADACSDVRHAAALLLNARSWVANDAQQAMFYALATRRWSRLSDMGPPAVEVLAIAVHGWNAEVRCEAVRALGKIQTPESIALLIPALSDADTQVRLSAAFALDLLGWSPSTNQEHATHLLASERWTAFAALGLAALPILRDAFTTYDDTSQQQLGQALAALGPPGTALLIGALDHTAMLARLYIARLLGELHIHDAIPALQAAASHDVSAEVRNAAAKALEQIASPHT